jgi:head-tail adaptor
MPSSAQLRDRNILQRKGVQDDEYGNEISETWEDQFTVAANITPAVLSRS